MTALDRAAKQRGAVLSEPTETAVVVVRRWKRDGTTNVMSMDAAAENLRVNGLDTVEDVDAVPIAARLLRGEKLETTHATFVVAWLG